MLSKGQIETRIKTVDAAIVEHQKQLQQAQASIFALAGAKNELELLLSQLGEKKDDEPPKDDEGLPPSD
jgi:outer membrane protein TolC